MSIGLFADTANIRITQIGGYMRLSVLIALTGILTACAKPIKTAEAPKDTPEGEAKEAPKPPGPEQYLFEKDDRKLLRQITDEVKAQPNLLAAIESVSPLVQEEPVDPDEPPLASLILATWASDKLTMEDITALPTIKYEEVRKDLEQALGKSICEHGRISAITAKKADGHKVYVGSMSTMYGRVYSFVAVKSTGTLVDWDYATFCGVVMGRLRTGNSSERRARGVHLVGMFDLPENHGPSPTPVTKRGPF